MPTSIKKPKRLVAPPSVLDNPLERLLRRGAEVLGVSEPSFDPSDLAPGPMAIMPMGSPWRNVTLRARRLAHLGQQANRLGTSAADAFRYLSRRYPRVMSHIGSISDDVGEGATGAFTPGPLEKAGLRQKGTIGKLGLNPTHLRTPEQYVDTIAHEATHTGQALRTADRLERMMKGGKLPSLDVQDRLLPPDLMGFRNYITPGHMVRAEAGPLATGIRQKLHYGVAGGTHAPLGAATRRQLSGAADYASQPHLKAYGQDVYGRPGDLDEMLEPLRQHRRKAKKR